MSREWLAIGLTCTNCGKPLAARAGERDGSIVISGLEPIEYRHEDGTTECVIKYSPAAYDDWKGNRALREAEQRCEAPHDER